MRKVFSVTGWQMRKLATEWAEAGQKKSFQELLQILYKRGDYQSQSAALPVNDHWDQLDPTAFLTCSGSCRLSIHFLTGDRRGMLWRRKT